MRTVLAILAFALVFAAAAAATTPARYRAQATAICKAADVKLAKLAKADPPGAPTTIAPFVRGSLVIFELQFAQLRILAPPASLRHFRAKALAAQAEELAGLKLMLAKIAAGADPQKTFAAASATLTPVGHAEAAAWKALKIPACATT